MSTYPNNIPVFPTLTDEVDVVAANDENSARNEIIALATYVGTNPQGSRGSLADRMNVCIGSYGGIQNGTAFPADTTPHRLFYRDDSETLYVRNFANNSWNALGGSLSDNILSHLISFNGTVNLGTFSYPIQTKFKKISGVSILQFYYNLNSGSGNNAWGVLDIGFGLLNATTNKTTTTAWVVGTMDISGLVSGSVYDIRIGFSSDGGPDTVTVSAFQIFGA